MSQLTNSNPPEIEENKEFDSVEDLLEEFSHKVTPVKTFSDSSLSNIKQEAKKLKKSLQIEHKEALDKAAINRGFKSFKDMKNRFEYWKSLPTVYIYISKNETVYQTKEVFSKLPDDDKSKSIKELMEQNKNNSLGKWFDQSQSFAKPSEPVTLLNNQKFGIKLLSEEEKDEFFTAYNQKKSSKVYIINRNEDYLFKFIHYKFYPNVEQKIRDELEKSSKEYNFSFSEMDVKGKITDVIDTNLRAYLTTEIYTEDTFISEVFDVFPHAYIVNHEYYNAVDLYDAPFEEYGAFYSSDY